MGKMRRRETIDGEREEKSKDKKAGELREIRSRGNMRESGRRTMW